MRDEKNLHHIFDDSADDLDGQPDPETKVVDARVKQSLNVGVDGSPLCHEGANN